MRSTSLPSRLELLTVSFHFHARHLLPGRSRKLGVDQEANTSTVKLHCFHNPGAPAKHGFLTAQGDVGGPVTFHHDDDLFLDCQLAPFCSF